MRHSRRCRLCSARAPQVNLDKNLPSNQGELPAITLHLVSDGDGGADADAPPPPNPLVRQKTSQRDLDRDLLAGASIGSAGSSEGHSVSPTSSGKAFASAGGSGNARLRNAASEMMLGFGIAQERRDKDALVVAAEAFADGSAFEFDQRTAGALSAAAAATSSMPTAGLFDRAAGSKDGSPKALKRRGSVSSISSTGSMK